MKTTVLGRARARDWWSTLSSTESMSAGISVPARDEVRSRLATIEGYSAASIAKSTITE